MNNNITKEDNTFSPRYHNPIVNNLLIQIQENRKTQEQIKESSVKIQRKMHHSMSLSASRQRDFEQRPLFNNKTKQGDLLQQKIKPIPYLFIPKYKNETFIMPDRIFEKGRAGKRFHIKMKDTAIYSFRDTETQQINSVIRKEEKQKTIISRKAEQFNRVVDANDGRKRAEHNTWYLKNRKQFNFTNTSVANQLFSVCQPILGPKEPQTVLKRKVSLAKTFDFRNKWRPNSRGSQAFNSVTSNSVYHHLPHTESLM